MTNHENRKRGYIHFVLEVPHLVDPTAWWASDEADYLSRAMSGWRDSQDEEYFASTHDMDRLNDDGEAPDLPLTISERFGLVSRISGDDLSAYYVCRGRHEARELLKELRGQNAPRIGKCGPLRAADALERELRKWKRGQEVPGAEAPGLSCGDLLLTNAPRRTGGTHDF